MGGSGGAIGEMVGEVTYHLDLEMGWGLPKHYLTQNPIEWYSIFWEIFKEDKLTINLRS